MSTARIQRSYFSATCALFLLGFLLAPALIAQYRRSYQAAFFSDLIRSDLSLIKVKKTSVDSKLGQGIRVLENIAGPSIRAKKLGISSYFLTPPCDASRGDLAPFRLVNDTAYLLVKDLGRGRLALPGPDNGVMYASAGWVAWGFLHPALPIYVSERIFRATFLPGWICLMKHKPGSEGWTSAQEALSKKVMPYLLEPPAPMGGELDTLHYQQSYALEWVALLGIPLQKEILYPFWESQHVKHRLSAIRAAAGLPEQQSTEFWLNGLKDPNWKDYERLLALQSLIQHKAELPTPESLQRLRNTLSSQNTRLPLTLDDPRFCSSYPSLQSLVEKWVQLHQH